MLKMWGKLEEAMDYFDSLISWAGDRYEGEVALAVLREAVKPRVVTREWFQRLATSIIYHHGTNDPEGIYWPEAKAMLREQGVEVEEAMNQLHVWDFIPEGWEVPLGFDHVVANAKAALAHIRARLGEQGGGKKSGNQPNKMTARPHFLSFIREFGQNPAYDSYNFGRIEVWNEASHYAEDEIRYSTTRHDEFHAFRDKWDFKNVTDDELAEVRRVVAERFSERPKEGK